MSMNAGRLMDKAGFNGGENHGFDLGTEQGVADARALVQSCLRAGLIGFRPKGRPTEPPKSKGRFKRHGPDTPFGERTVARAVSLAEPFKAAELAAHLGFEEMKAYNTLARWKAAGWVARARAGGWVRTQRFAS